MQNWFAVLFGILHLYSETCTFIHCELGLKVQRPDNPSLYILSVAYRYTRVLCGALLFFFKSVRDFFRGSVFSADCRNDQ